MKIIISTGNLVHIGHDTREAQDMDIQALRAEGFNYFVRYKEVGYPFATQATRVTDTKKWPHAEDPRWYIVQ